MLILFILNFIYHLKKELPGLTLDSCVSVFSEFQNGYFSLVKHPETKTAAHEACDKKTNLGQIT